MTNAPEARDRLERRRVTAIRRGLACTMTVAASLTSSGCAFSVPHAAGADHELVVVEIAKDEPVFEGSMPWNVGCYEESAGHLDSCVLYSGSAQPFLSIALLAMHETDRPMVLIHPPSLLDMNHADAEDRFLTCYQGGTIRVDSGPEVTFDELFYVDSDDTYFQLTPKNKQSFLDLWERMDAGERIRIAVFPRTASPQQVDPSCSEEVFELDLAGFSNAKRSFEQVVDHPWFSG